MKATVEDARLLRSISKGGKVGKNVSDWSIGPVVEDSSKQIGTLRRLRPAPHLRKTVPEEWRGSGADQEIEIAMNDNIGL
jgi:hypothetical protein